MIDTMLPKPCGDGAPSRSESPEQSTCGDDVPVLSIMESPAPVLLPRNDDNDGVDTVLWGSPSFRNANDGDDLTSNTKIGCTGLSSFPFRLHDMLNDASKKGFVDVVCWRADDRSFLIRDKDRFAAEVLPNYFQGQTHYKSFQRQLNIYGFTRVVGGSRRDMGTYTHRLLVRGEPKLCRFMIRTKIKNKGARTRRLHAQLGTSTPQQPAGAWSQLAGELPTNTMCLVDNHHVLANMVTRNGTFPANNHLVWQNASLPMVSLNSTSSTASDQEDLVLASTKRLQVLEERNIKILKLLEMRLSLLEMKTLETAANVGMGLSSQHPIDSHATIANDKSYDESGVTAWNLDIDVSHMIGATITEHIIPKGDETLEEEMENLDNIFNICDSLSDRDHFPIPLELFASSGDMDADNIVSAHSREHFVAQHAMYPDVAAELVRIFG